MDSREQKTRGKRSSFVSFWYIFNQADGWDLVLMCLALIGALGDGVSMPAMMVIVNKMLNSYGQTLALTEPHTLNITERVAPFCYLACWVWVTNFLVGYCWTRTAERQASRIRMQYLKAVMRQDVTYFDLHVTSTAKVIESVSTDSLLIQTVLSEKFPNFVMSLSSFFGAYIASFIILWRLAVVGFPFIVFLIVPGMMYGRALNRIARKMKDEYNKANIIVEQTLSLVRTVYSFVGESRTIEAYSNSLQETMKLGLKQGLSKGLAIGSNGVTFAIWSFMTYYGSKLVLRGGAQGGTLYVVGFAMTTGGLALGAGLQNIKYFSEASAAIERIMDMIERVPDIDPYNMEGQILDSLIGEVELKHIKFAYPSRPDILIFDDFCMRIPARKKVALIGGSGSGKSTVIALLQRFYDPLGGEILLDGVAINKLQLKWLRSQMGLVSQEPIMFATSIKQNILFGNEDASTDQVIEAAKTSNAHNFISQLPQGYDTQVGEGGIQISCGQKQRIAIARAIIKVPKILLLDEATSALDTESEKIVQEALDKVAIGRTTIIIAHRLSTIRHTDLIIVIQNGKVIEMGSHDDLILNDKGSYTSLLRLQEMENTEGFSNNNIIPISYYHKVSNADDSLSNPKDLKNGPYQSDNEIIFASSNKEFIKTPSFKRLFAMNLPEWKQATVGCLGAFLFGVVKPIYAFIIGSMVAVFFLPSHHLIMEKIQIYSLCFLGLAVFSLITNVIQHYNFAIMGERLTKRIREKVLSNVLTFEIGWFDKEENTTGAICARLSNDANVVRSIVGDRMCLLVQTFSTVAIASTISLIIAWRLALVILLMQPIIIVGYYFRHVMLKTMSSKEMKAQEQSSKLATEVVFNHRTITSFTSHVRILNMLETTQEAPKKENIYRSWIAGIGLGTCNSLVPLNWALSFWYGGRLIMIGYINAKVLFQTFLVLSTTSRSIADAGTMTNDLTKGAYALESFFAILDRVSLIEPEDENSYKPEKLKGYIEFCDIDFAYPMRPDVLIFKGFSFDIRAGESTALVGHSGSGKSTIINLIERFFDPLSGSIKIDNRDIKSYHLRSMRKHVGLVSQEPTLFSSTIRQNIAYGASESVDEIEIIEAAKIADAHDFISGLKMVTIHSAGIEDCNFLVDKSNELPLLAQF